jgi:hypothetical protein
MFKKFLQISAFLVLFISISPVTVASSLLHTGDIIVVDSERTWQDGRPRVDWHYPSDINPYDREHRRQVTKAYWYSAFDGNGWVVYHVPLPDERQKLVSPIIIPNQDYECCGAKLKPTLPMIACTCCSCLVGCGVGFGVSWATGLNCCAMGSGSGSAVAAKVCAAFGIATGSGLGSCILGGVFGRCFGVRCCDE